MPECFTREDTNAAKGIGAMLLLYHHLFWKIIDNYSRGVFKYLLLQIETVHLIGVVGKICVSIFVLLSTYGMSVQYAKLENDGCISGLKQTSRFVARRYLTLMAGFWFVYLIVYIAACFTSKSPAVVYADYAGVWRFFVMLADVMGLQYYFGTPTLNATWWYMTLAIQMIVLQPFLYRWCKKGGLVLLAVLLLIPRNMLSVSPYICAYIFSGALGVYCAQNNVFLRMRGLGEKKGSSALLARLLKTAALAFCIWALAVLRYTGEFVYEKQLFHFTDPVLAFCVILLCYLTVCSREWLRAPFAFIGKHSMNIFLIHTLLYAHFYKPGIREVSRFYIFRGIVIERACCHTAGL